MPAISPTHVGNTGTVTFIKPQRNSRPGRSGTTSSSGLQGGRTSHLARAL